jgi:NADH:ubiquinone oxidoreductase subunit B-like Fe-S oxidoreductase
MIIFEIFVAHLSDKCNGSRMNQKMKALVNKLGLVCKHVEMIDWQVMHDMTRWIVARALSARQSKIIRLAHSVLTRLIDVG